MLISFKKVNKKKKIKIKMIHKMNKDFLSGLFINKFKKMIIRKKEINLIKGKMRIISLFQKRFA